MGRRNVRAVLTTATVPPSASCPWPWRPALAPRCSARWPRCDRQFIGTAPTLLVPWVLKICRPRHEPADEQEMDTV